jgi:hypothetical protein
MSASSVTPAARQIHPYHERITYTLQDKETAEKKVAIFVNYFSTLKSVLEQKNTADFKKTALTFKKLSVDLWIYKKNFESRENKEVPPILNQSFQPQKDEMRPLIEAFYYSGGITPGSSEVNQIFDDLVRWAGAQNIPQTYQWFPSAGC